MTVFKPHLTAGEKFMIKKAKKRIRQTYVEAGESAMSYDTAREILECVAGWQRDTISDYAMARPKRICPHIT